MSAEEKENNAIMNLSKLSLSCRILGQAAFPTLLLEDIRISGKYGHGTYSTKCMIFNVFHIFH